MERHIYTREDCGCFADGANGVEYVEAMAVEYAREAGWRGCLEICEGTVSWEPDEAIDYLSENTLADDGICFAFVDGDLLLIEEDQL